MKITIHSNPRIPWQSRLTSIVKTGLKRHGVTVGTSSVPQHQHGTDVAIIFGPNFWKPIENSGAPYIMMNRKFLGSGKQDVHNNVAISWDGFNGRGTFCVDEVDPKRFERYIAPYEYCDWRTPGQYYLMCEQTDTGRCTKYGTINSWYQHVTRNTQPIRIRKKCASEIDGMKTFKKGFEDDIRTAKAAIVLNSTVSTDMLLAGVPVISMDEGDPTYSINSHDLGNVKYPDRLPFLQFLSHCQWHYDEIENGNFWAQIYPKRGPRLCEWK